MFSTLNDSHPQAIQSIKQQAALPPLIQLRIIENRRTIKNILTSRRGPRLLVVGPCALQSPESALEYADKLQALQPRVQDSFFFVMRAYYEKARSAGGWTGLVYSGWPIDHSRDPNASLMQTRQALIDINRLGMPVASEFVDPLITSCLADIISYGTIGARTAYSQPHRMLASALPMPIGIKNALDGSLDSAISAVRVAQAPQTFLGALEPGIVNWIQSQGNASAHVILRGGTSGPNYFAPTVDRLQEALQSFSLCPSVVIDCAHGNGSSNARGQIDVFQHVVTEQMSQPASCVRGLMLESFLDEGSLRNTPGGSPSRVSLVDPCLGWDTTEQLILESHNFLQKRSPHFS